MGGLSFTDLSFSEGILWQGCGLQIFGKSGVDYKMEKQYPGISCLLFPISAQALMNGGKNVMAFILFTREKEKQQKEIILIGLFW